MSREGSLRLEHLTAYVAPEAVDVGLEVVTKHAFVGVFAPVFGALGWLTGWQTGRLAGLHSLVSLLLFLAQDIHAIVNQHLISVLRGGRHLGL